MCLPSAPVILTFDLFVSCIDQITKHMQQEQQNAATLIQTRWRGYRVRSGLDRKREKVHRVKAAIRIQRGVRICSDNICKLVFCIIHFHIVMGVK